MECVVPMRLTGGAYAVYQQLADEKKTDFACIKRALFTAFALDPVTAWKEFMARKLHPGETVDVYLAELKKLSVLFGGMSDKGLVCAFVAGLPKSVEDLLRASSQVDEMDISEVLARARAILKKSPNTIDQVAAVQPSQVGLQDLGAATTCYKCGGPNHLARDCLSSRQPTRKLDGPQCYKCKKRGHLARTCPGNGQGEEATAPVFSPDRH